VETLAPVVRLSRTPADVRLPPPALGEHTAEVLANLKSRV
jgi:crotonobetainyl-CoA:carnitine CoA-transferase CaiB-like acyl-CoA transferase